MRRLCAGLPPDLSGDHSSDVCRCDGLHADNLEEDTWVGEVRIGEAVLTYNKDCTRCVGTKVGAECLDILLMIFLMLLTL